MLLAPGPIPQLGPDLSFMVPEQPEFYQLAIDELAEMPGLESELDIFLGDPTLFDDSPFFTDVDYWVDQGYAARDAALAFDFNAQINQMQASVQDNIEAIQLANSAAPAEIWDPVPAPLQLVGTPPPAPTGQGPTSILIENLSRPGQAQFQVGDQYRILIQVSAGSGTYTYAGLPVQIGLAHNGIAQNAIDLVTDQFGQAPYTASFTANDVGTWHAYAFPQGAGPVIAAIDWSVLGVAAPPPPPPPSPTELPITVLFFNLETGDPLHFIIGQHWKLSFTGPANAFVNAHLNQDGYDRGDAAIGYTDATGHLDAYGTMGDASLVGYWTETYTIGGQPWQGQLQFSVAPY